MNHSQAAVTDRADVTAPGSSGEFLDMDGERWYAIRHFDSMPPFFSSIISDSDHWLFISSTGGLTAGRVAPETALFPYITVDRIHESAPHTGSKTLLRVGADRNSRLWEPFNREHDDRYQLTRNLYKSALGNKICFEEINHDLQLAFRYRWCSSDAHGFVRQCELENLAGGATPISLLDGLQNLLPAGTPRNSQDLSSNLVDAYKWSELDVASGLGIYCLYSALSDRAEPAESLRSTTAFSTGLESPTILLSSQQLDAFRRGATLHTEQTRRGIRGAFMVNSERALAGSETLRWQIVCGLEQSQGDVVALRQRLADRDSLEAELQHSIDSGSQALATIMASSDGFQTTAEEQVTLHHYANVLFNVLRGGIFDDQYTISGTELRAAIARFNAGVYARNSTFLDGLGDSLTLQTLLDAVASRGDAQLERLCLEYLPITFGRRHGDPSRPWNRFAIRLRDEHGQKILAYEGNWRDIFQNWEALALSYPGFTESMIAKFVNASTMDGYNPYRITSEGIDWEVEDPEDPWSYIGYWGDHQIIYLQKLLELSRAYHPQRLSGLLHRPVFAYANVPYRIKPLAELLVDSKNTVLYDSNEALRIEQLVESMGADGKLVLDDDGNVRQVSLMEKLLVPLLAKLGNLVIDGGIWLNTQRPEWNDANNALVGNGLSMVTLYYLRRYIMMLRDLIADSEFEFEISADVADWLRRTTAVLARHAPEVTAAALSDERRFEALRELAGISSEFRERVYVAVPLRERSSLRVADISELLDRALQVTDASIGRNRREDGLYHAYNLLKLHDSQARLETLYPMLEGQVAALSSGALPATEAVTVIEALFASPVFRPDQKTFMLYPDRELPGFLEKNIVDADAARAIPFLRESLASGDTRLIYCDADGNYRFNADFANAGDVRERLDLIAAAGAEIAPAQRQAIAALFEATFNHRAFTGRSGGMFGFEGLGCVYWHMVSKLLVAVQECYFRALDQGEDAATVRRLGELYYQVRLGIGFNKTPAEYGAFPTDPYSHTPGHAGAQQPGMTGQVKEELITRMGELGLRVADGATRFEPTLLREQEFLRDPAGLCYLDVDGEWRTLALPEGSLGFTWCQLPCIYTLADPAQPQLSVTWNDGRVEVMESTTLPAHVSAEVFARSGRVRELRLQLSRDQLFAS